MMGQSIKVRPLPGGLALSRKANANVRPSIYDLPLQPRYYLPLINYFKELIQPVVEVGDSVEGGELLAQGIVAPTSGHIVDQIEHPWLHPSNTTVQTLVLQADNRDSFPAWKPLDATQYSQAEKLQRVEQAAIHGLGGAAFNTAKKIERACAENETTLIINAVECEPGICCDDALLQQQSSDVLKACGSLCNWLGISTALFAIEDDKPNAIEEIQAAMGKHNHSIQLIVLPAIYPSGAEAPLVQRLTGITLAKNQRAADIGVLCLNVATILSIHRALQGHACVERIVSVTTQDCDHSVNIRTRFGTPIDALLAYAGTQSDIIKNELDRNSSTVRIGGPLSGFNNALNTSPVVASTNAILVGSEAKLPEPSACIRCTECSLVCPVNILPQELYTAAKTNNLELAERYSLDSCVLCGCCDLVCPASIALTDWFRFAKDSANQQNNEIKAANAARQRSEKRNERLQHQKIKKSQTDADRRKAAAQYRSSSEDIKAALTRVKKKRPES